MVHHSTLVVGVALRIDFVFRAQFTAFLCQRRVLCLQSLVFDEPALEACLFFGKQRFQVGSTCGIDHAVCSCDVSLECAALLR